MKSECLSVSQQKVKLKYKVQPFSAFICKYLIVRQTQNEKKWHDQSK